MSDSGDKNKERDDRADSRFINGKHKEVNIIGLAERRGLPAAAFLRSPLPAMPLVFRTLLFGFVTLLVVLLIIDDIAEVEKETA